MNAARVEVASPGQEAPSAARDSLEAIWQEDEASPTLPDEDAVDELDDLELADTPTTDARRPALPAAVPDAKLVEWLDAIVEQDDRALAALYDATFARVFGIARRIVRRTALAEEVVEDTYFQVWRQAVRFDPARGSAITWLLSIARSRAIDAVRREARFQHDPLDEEQGAAPADAPVPQDELLDLARHHAELHRALLLLGPQPRQLVSLAFFRGLSHEEIASQTALPLGTVKSQIRRALHSLRQILGEGGLTAFAA